MKWIVIWFLLLAHMAFGRGEARLEGIDPGLVELIEKIDEKGASIETLCARFLQRKEISLLKEPVEKRGSFYLKKPDGIRLEFDPKEDLAIIMTNEEMVAISHGAKRADRVKLKKRRGDLAQKILSDKLNVMLNYFTITRAVKTDGSGGQRLVLTPSKRKVKKKFQEIQIWVNKDYLIFHIKVTSKDGDVNELLLEDIRLNEELKAGLFNTEIPEDYELGDRMEFLFGAGIAF